MDDVGYTSTEGASLEKRRETRDVSIKRRRQMDENGKSSTPPRNIQMSKHQVCEEDTGYLSHFERNQTKMKSFFNRSSCSISVVSYCLERPDLSSS